MTQALRDLGFEVIEVTNASKKQMIEAVNDFGMRLQQQAYVGLFYYAGHGAQYHGSNYLIPLHTTIKASADLEQETVDAGWILGRMEKSQIALNIVILDACRDNPFRNLIAFRSYGERGLVALAPSIRGSLIAYATQPDNVAADGTGRNGTYTKHLLRYLKQPGLSLPALFNEVGLAVSKETNYTQVPWVNSSPLPPFCFAGCQPSSSPVPFPQGTMTPTPPPQGSPGSQADGQTSPQQSAALPPTEDVARIYKAMRITPLKIVGGPFKSSDTVKVKYTITNMSAEDIEIPLTTSPGTSRTMYLIGAHQHWIERLGEDDTIEAIPPHTARLGRRYAAGGSIIPAPQKLLSGYAVPFERTIKTAGFPRGKYRYWTEYKEAFSERVLQSEYVEFELR